MTKTDIDKSAISPLVQFNACNYFMDSGVSFNEKKRRQTTLRESSRIFYCNQLNLFTRPIISLLRQLNFLLFFRFFGFSVVCVAKLVEMAIETVSKQKMNTI